MAVFCSAGVPRKSRPGPMQAQTEPMARPCLSAAAFTLAASMCSGASIGISTVWKPHFLKVGKSLTLWVVKGEVNRNVLMPILISVGGARLVHRGRESKENPSFPSPQTQAFMVGLVLDFLQRFC